MNSLVAITVKIRKLNGSKADERDICKGYEV